MWDYILIFTGLYSESQISLIFQCFTSLYIERVKGKIACVLILTICHVHSAVPQGEGRVAESGGECICSGHDLKIPICCSCLDRVICMPVIWVSLLPCFSCHKKSTENPQFTCIFVYFSSSHQQMAPHLPDICSLQAQLQRTRQLLARQERNLLLWLRLGAPHMRRFHR